MSQNYQLPSPYTPEAGLFSRQYKAFMIGEETWGDAKGDDVSTREYWLVYGVSIIGTSGVLTLIFMYL